MRIFADGVFLDVSAHYDASAAKAKCGFVIGGLSLSNYPRSLIRSFRAAPVLNKAPALAAVQALVFGRYSHKSAIPHCGHFGVRATQM